MEEEDQAEGAAEHAETSVEGGETSTEVVEESGGMPQLDFGTFDNQIFWLILALVAIYMIVTRLAMPRIDTVLATRSGGISGDLQAAEALRAQAREAEAAYAKALAEARAEASRIAGEARAEIQAGLDAELARADARIAERAAEGQRAIAEIDAEADASVAEVARDVARELVAALGGTPDEAAVDAAVSQRTGG